MYETKFPATSSKQYNTIMGTCGMCLDKSTALTSVPGRLHSTLLIFKLREKLHVIKQYFNFFGTSLKIEILF